MRELELAAKVLGVKLQYLDILEPKDVETAFRAAAEGRADGVTTFASAMVVSQRAQIVELAAKNRLPGIYHNSQFSEAGGTDVLWRERSRLGPPRRHVRG